MTRSTMRKALHQILPLLLMGSSAAAVLGQTPCGHIQVLSKDEANEVVADDYEGSAMSPGPNQTWVVAEAGKLMTPLLCAAVRRVAFFDQDLDKNAGLAGRTDRRTADLLQMSAADSPRLASEQLLRLPEELEEPRSRVPQDIRKYELAKASAELARGTTMQAILHEAAHAADYLLQQQGAGEPGFLRPVGEEATWDSRAKSLAREAIARNRLKKGLRKEWKRIHEAFVAAGMAKPYHGKGLKSDMSSQELVFGGFMSGYGGDKVSDDIAEMTAWALVTEGYDATAGGESLRDQALACAAMNRLLRPTISTNWAAVFTKLGFLQSLGFISEEAFDRCVGPLKIRGDGPGFHSFKSSVLSRSYQGNVSRSLGQIDGKGPFIFEMSATGTVTTSAGEFPARVVLQINVSPPVLVPGEIAEDLAGSYLELDDVSYPRGVYFVGFAHGRHNKFEIYRTDNGHKVMEVAQGVALVARANRDLIEGSLFVQKYLNYSGGLLSAIGGPEPPKEPTSITFRFEQ